MRFLCVSGTAVSLGGRTTEAAGDRLPPAAASPVSVASIHLCSSAISSDSTLVCARLSVAFD